MKTVLMVFAAMFLVAGGWIAYHENTHPWYVYHGTASMTSDAAQELAEKYTTGITTIPTDGQDVTVVYDFGSRDKVPGLEWSRNNVLVDGLPAIVLGIIGLGLLLSATSIPGPKRATQLERHYANKLDSSPMGRKKDESKRCM